MAASGSVASAVQLHFPSEAVRHPRVFVYNSTNLERFLAAQSDADAKEWAFGRALGEGFRSTDTWALAAMLIYRLTWQRPAWRTTNAEEADLFVIPLLPRSPRYGTATEYGSDFRFEVEPMCDHLFGDDLARSYAHLDAESASRHVVVALGWTPILSFCAIHPSGRYGSKRPVSQRLLRRMRWLMHEEFETPEASVSSYHSAVPVLRGAQMVNAPFPSAIHSTAALQRGLSSPRRFLLAFAGSLNGSPQSRALRKAIDASCRRVGEPACRVHGFAAGTELGSSAIVDAYRLKRAATFCAEPGGHNVIRKGVVDALLNGCIPITFLEAHQLRKLWPHHLFGWRDDAILNLRPSALRNASGALDFDLPALVRAIPQARVAAIQRAIGAHAQRLAYLAERKYHGEDALAVLLKGLAFGLPG